MGIAINFGGWDFGEFCIKFGHGFLQFGVINFPSVFQNARKWQVASDEACKTSSMSILLINIIIHQNDKLVFVGFS